MLGAWLRFYHLNAVYVGVDHAYPVGQAIRWLQLGEWPTLGEGTSILFANPPGMSYLMALPWELFNSQWGTLYFVAALNLLVVPLTYRLGRMAGGERPGLAAATLASLNPWTIYFSRATWVQGLLPFWSTLTCVVLLLALYSRGAARHPARRARLLLGALLALTGLTQMYLLAFLSVAPVTLILLLNWRRLPWRSLALGLAILAAATGLYGWQIVRDWPNQARNLAKFTQTGPPGVAVGLDLTALQHAERLVTGADYDAIFANDGSTAWQVRRSLGQSMSLILLALLELGVAWAVWQVARRTPNSGPWLALLIWWATPIAALLSVPGHPVNIAYLLLSLPAGYVLAGPMLARLIPRRLGLPALLALSAVAYVLISAAMADVEAQPARYALDDISDGAVLKLRPVLQAVADEYHLTEFYTGLDPASLSAKVGRPMQTVPWTPLPKVELFQVDQPAVYLRMEHGSRPPTMRLASTVAEVDYPGQAFVTFDLIRAYTRAELAALPQHAVGWPSAQGLTLVGYDLEQGNQSLWVYWTVDALVDGREQWLYAPYAHVVDAQGRTAASSGAPGLPGYYYRQGDVFLSHITLPAVPAGDYHLDLSMYDGLHRLSLILQPPGGAAPIDYYRGELVNP